jgi:hypothetical protein
MPITVRENKGNLWLSPSEQFSFWGITKNEIKGGKRKNV